MNKQTKHPSLFDQALAIAINEGKAESSKDADPSQSGVDGENYLLFSKEQKLLISIPLVLENLKRNTGNVSNTGTGCNGCLVRSVFVIIILSVISAISIPKYPKMAEKARSAAAVNTLATMAKECAAKIANAGTGTSIVPELQGYRSNKKNIAGFYVGNNRKISGTRIVCPTTGEIKLVSENERTYPTFSYNVGTGKKTCNAVSGSDAEKRGCLNGYW